MNLDLRRTFVEYQFKKDKNEIFNYGQFKTYYFNERLIIEYSKTITDLEDRIKYFSFIMREYELFSNNFEFIIDPDIEKKFYYSEYYDMIHREAILYSSYKDGE